MNINLKLATSLLCSVLFMAGANAQTGNVGVGTTTPQERLHVVGGQFGLHGTGLNGLTNPLERFVIYADQTYGLLFEAPLIGSSKQNITFSWRGTGLTNPPLFIQGSTGNVGIGTTTPFFKLEVDGDLRATKYVVQNQVDGGSGRGIYMWDELDPNWGIYMGQSGSSKSLSGGVAVAGAGFSQHAIRSRVNNSATQGFIWENSGEMNLMSLRGSDGLLYVAGNVGIGTPIPETKLHISSGNLLIDAALANEKGIYFRSGYVTSNKYNTSIFTYDHNGSSADGISINGSDGISFNTGSNNRNERMRIDINGNVGIGTTDPNNKLDIALSLRSGTHATNRALYVTGDFGTNSTGVEFRHTNGSQGIGLGYNTIYATGSNPNQDLGLKALGATGNLLFTTNNTQRMIILGTGNVGIGTTDPKSTLEVNGSLGVSTYTLPNTITAYTMGNNNEIVLIVDNSTPASRTVTLPTASSTNKGRIYTIKCKNLFGSGSGLSVTVTGFAPVDANNGSNYTLGTTQVGSSFYCSVTSITCISNGSNWYVISDVVRFSTVPL